MKLRYKISVLFAKITYFDKMKDIIKIITDATEDRIELIYPNDSKTVKVSKILLMYNSK